MYAAVFAKYIKKYMFKSLRNGQVNLCQNREEIINKNNVKIITKPVQKSMQT